MVKYFGQFNVMRIFIRKKSDALFLAICTVLGIILTFALTGAITGYRMYENIGGRPLLNSGFFTGNARAKPAWQILGLDQLSVLLIGTDEHLEFDAGRSDTIIWAFMDFRKGKVDIVSIPRDTLIWQPKRHPGFDKICHAYGYGGADFVKRTIEDFIGVRIDQVVKVDYGGFKEIVDALGGVEVDVEKDMHYTDRAGDLYIDLKKGRQVLDGDHALEYVRFRHDKMGDYGRVDRQQEFLSALKHQGLRLTKIGKIDDVSRIITKSVTFSPAMDYRDVATILLFFIKLDDNSLNFHSVPVAKDVSYHSLSAIAPDYQGLDKLVHGIIIPSEEDGADG